MSMLIGTGLYEISWNRLGPLTNSLRDTGTHRMTHSVGEDSMSEEETNSKNENLCKCKDACNCCSKSEKDLAREETMQKKVSYYQALVSAWIAHRFEKDKQILTLSALAVGWMMTFRNEVHDSVAFIIWLFAIGLFVLSVFLILFGFQRNTDYIELVVKDVDAEKERKIQIAKQVKLITRTALFSFCIGVILIACLAIYQSDFITKSDCITSILKKGAQDVRQQE